MGMTDAFEDQLHDLVAAARRAGADAAEARAARIDRTQVAVRAGKLETVQREEPEVWSLRVWAGARSATLTSIDLSAPEARGDLVERVLTMARLAPEDPYAGLAPAAIIRSVSLLDEAPLQLYDPAEPSVAELEALARAAEAGALAVDGVTRSNGGGATMTASLACHVTSEGLSAVSRRSAFQVSAAAVAGADGAMETDGYGRGAAWLSDLPDAASIGTEAGRRAAARLGARKLASTRAPVIFERRVSMQVLGPCLAAISGAAVARGSSFLKDRLGRPVFARGVRLLDDPAVVRGLASRLADEEGLPARPRALIDDGVLTGWMLGVSSGRQLGLEPNGARPSNLTLAPGPDSLAELMAKAGTGLLVTGMFGPSLNPENGDWSAGVSGVWFERGEPVHPVNEITAAGSLPEFYARLIPGSDLVIEGAANAPSLLVDDVSIAGA